ncbi:hypothetical protein IWW50_005862, partial [Coemansia erecta]
TYLQLCKAEWQLHQVNSTNVSRNGALPALVYNESTVESGFWRIVQLLKKQGYDLDASLDEEQLVQSTAYISMIQDGLVDALLFSWYLVPENFVEAIRPRLAKLFGFPLSLAIPTQLQDYAERRLKAVGISAELENAGSKAADDGSEPGSLSSKLPRIYLLAKEGFRRHADKSAHPIYDQADQYLAALSKKLDKKQYFFGEKPSTLDAVAFGCLSLITHVDLPQNTLKTSIAEKYPNLVAFCDRIHAQLGKPNAVSEQSMFASLGSIIKHSISRYANIPTPSRASDSKPADPDRAAKIRSAAGALFVFFGYIIYNGILSAPSSEKPHEAAAMVHRLEVGDIVSAVKNL